MCGNPRRHGDRVVVEDGCAIVFPLRELHAASAEDIDRRYEFEMFIFIDTETTGPGPEDRLCQIAYKTDEGPMVDELFNPGLQISIESIIDHEWC